MIARRALPAVLLPWLARPALAQPAWPARTVRLVIPWPPGQSTDLVGRVMAQRLSERLGQQVVPENRPGAGGAIGTDAVAKAAPDGYTLLAASIGPISFNPLVNRVPYDVERDLATVATFTGSPYFLVVKPDFPAQDARTFLELLRTNPGRYSYASSGVGGAQHVITALFLARAELDALHVPFPGSGPAMASLLGGQVDWAIETLAAAGALVRNGQLRALGVTASQRSILMPDVPPLSEAMNAPDYNYVGWIGMMAPAATPQPIIERLAGELELASRLPENAERLASIGNEGLFKGPDDFRVMLRSQRETFGNVIRQLGIRAE